MACEGILIAAFLADCVIAVVGFMGSEDTPGGLSLVVILFLLSGTHRLRTGRWFGDD